MFAHDPSSLQESEIAEVEPFAEAVYDGYSETEPFAGYGEYYPQQYPQQQSFLQSMIPQIRVFWSPQLGRMMPHRWDLMLRRWVPNYGTPPGWQQGTTPPARRVYMRCNVWPGPPGLVPTAAGMPGMPGYPGMPGGMPGMPGMPGTGGGGRRRRRRRR